MSGAHLENSSTVKPCSGDAAAVGTAVGSFPCDAPGAINGWHADATTGLIHVRTSETAGDGSLCLVAEMATPPPASATCEGFLNTTGGCGGLTHAPSGDHSAESCAAACCGDLSCGTWQYLDAKDNPSPKGNCWVGVCPTLLNATDPKIGRPDPWVTGWRKVQPGEREYGRVVLGARTQAICLCL